MLPSTKNKRILILTTYPVDIPRHGGQHRVFNIVRLLRDNGHSVYIAGVLGSQLYPKSENFVSYPEHDVLAKYITNPFCMEDWAIGQLFSKNDEYFFGLVKQILPFCFLQGGIVAQPDIIFIEQPWLFQFAIRFKEEYLFQDTKIIYGSQNIEYRLKHNILLNYLPKIAATEGSEKVLSCELAAIRQADAVSCVSEKDMEWTQLHTQKPIILSKNGVRQHKCTISNIRQAGYISAHKKFALFCASAHPPNMKGFFDIFGNGVGCFSPDEKLVVAGSVGKCLVDDIRYSKASGVSESFVNAGEISDGLLQGLLTTSHAVLLPITQGGGTNLKTAEALWTGKHIIATSIAMRGFEEFIDSEGVLVTDEPGKFLKFVRRAMSLSPLEISTAERSRRRCVLWEETLTPLMKFIESV